MQGTQYATKRSILCRGAFCGPTLPRAYAVICGRFNITVNRDYLHAQNQGKLDDVCLQQFSSIFKSTIHIECTIKFRAHKG